MKRPMAYNPIHYLPSGSGVGRLPSWEDLEVEARLENTRRDQWAAEEQERLKVRRAATDAWIASQRVQEALRQQEMLRVNQDMMAANQAARAQWEREHPSLGAQSRGASQDRGLALGPLGDEQDDVPVLPARSLQMGRADPPVVAKALEPPPTPLARSLKFRKLQDPTPAGGN